MPACMNILYNYVLAIFHVRKIGGELPIISLKKKSVDHKHVHYNNKNFKDEKKVRILCHKIFPTYVQYLC